MTKIIIINLEVKKIKEIKKSGKLGVTLFTVPRRIWTNKARRWREMKQDSPHRDSYDLMEWIEDGKKFRRWWNHNMLPSQVTYRSRLCMEDLVCGVNPTVDKKRSAEQMDKLAASLPRSRADCCSLRVLDVNNECLLAYFPNVISSVWHQPNPQYPDSSQKKKKLGGPGPSGIVIHIHDHLRFSSIHINFTLEIGSLPTLPATQRIGEILFKRWETVICVR